jgi:hypothetical protein
MMKEEYRKKIEEIIDGIRCPDNFKCVEGGFERLCKATECGLEYHLECLETNRMFPCKFELLLDNLRFCQCPLRVFIAKNINEEKEGGM